MARPGGGARAFPRRGPPSRRRPPPARAVRRSPRASSPSLLRLEHDDERAIRDARIRVDAEEHHAAVLQPDVRVDQRTLTLEERDAHDDRLVAHPPGLDVQEAATGDVERLTLLPRAAPYLLADDLEGAVADEAAEA